MYSREFWDDIYTNNESLPWMSSEHQKKLNDLLLEYVPESVEGKRVLDYGCGSGCVGDGFLKRGAYVDFADISNKVVKLINDKYASCASKAQGVLSGEDFNGKVKVFSVSSPKDLHVDENSYDYIMALTVLHHINPENWSDFLSEFGKLLKKGGKLIISGRDESDAVLEEEGYKGRVTGQPTYIINSITQQIDPKVYEIEKTWVVKENFGLFDKSRSIMYFMLKRR